MKPDDCFNVTVKMAESRINWITGPEVGILTNISMINTTSERLKARNFFICQYFSFL